MTGMTPPAPKPDNPLRLNRSRIVILLLVALAAVSIIGALSGGLEGYQQLREGTQQQSGTAAEPAPAN